MDGTTEVKIVFKTPHQANAFAMLAEDGKLGEMINENAVVQGQLEDTEATVFYSESDFDPHQIEF